MAHSMKVHNCCPVHIEISSFIFHLKGIPNIQGSFLACAKPTPKALTYQNLPQQGMLHPKRVPALPTAYCPTILALRPSHLLGVVMPSGRTSPFMCPDFSARLPRLPWISLLPLCYISGNPIRKSSAYSAPANKRHCPPAYLVDNQDQLQWYTLAISLGDQPGSTSTVHIGN